MENIIKRLDEIEALIREQGVLQKAVLNFKETCLYLKLSKSFLYKLTSKKLIPHYCPEGKRLFFNREELDTWLLRNKSKAPASIEQQADDYLINKGKINI